MSEKKTVPLRMNLGGNWFVAGEVDVEVSDDGVALFEGRITDPHVSDLLTGQTSRNPLFKTAPFSIVEEAE